MSYYEFEEGFVIDNHDALPPINVDQVGMAGPEIREPRFLTAWFRWVEPHLLPGLLCTSNQLHSLSCHLIYGYRRLEVALGALQGEKTA